MSALIDGEGLWGLTTEAWRRRGIEAGITAALRRLSERGVDAVHVSFDLDVIDPTILPGTGTPVTGGLTADEASRAMDAIRAWDGPVRSIDWVELDPTRDAAGGSARLAVDLLAQLLIGPVP